MSIPPPFISRKRVKKGTAKARAPQVTPLPIIKRLVQKAAKKVPIIVDFKSKEEKEEEEAVNANSKSELSDVDLSKQPPFYSLFYSIVISVFCLYKCIFILNSYFQAYFAVF